MILHYSYKEGGAEPFTEKYVETVKDGMVTIEVTGFSPYVVALNDPKEEPETPPSDEPADGDTNLDGGGDNVPSSPNGDGSDVTDNDTGNTTNGIGNTTTDTGNTNNNSNINADNDEDKTVKAKTNGVKIQKQPQEKKAPKTGDMAPIAVWGILLLIAGIGIAVVVVKKRECK